MGRLGLLLGFLVGAGVATFLALARRGEEEGEAPATTAGVVDALRRQAQAAMAAGRDAAAEKEAQMRRRFDESTHRRP